jgi:hypothetical protein
VVYVAHDIRELPGTGYYGARSSILAALDSEKFPPARSTPGKPFLCSAAGKNIREIDMLTTSIHVSFHSFRFPDSQQALLSCRMNIIAVHFVIVLNFLHFPAFLGLLPLGYIYQSLPGRHFPCRPHLQTDRLIKTLPSSGETRSRS